MLTEVGAFNTLSLKNPVSPLPLPPSPASPPVMATHHYQVDLGRKEKPVCNDQDITDWTIFQNVCHHYGLTNEVVTALAKIGFDSLLAFRLPTYHSPAYHANNDTDADTTLDQGDGDTRHGYSSASSDVTQTRRAEVERLIDDMSLHMNTVKRGHGTRIKLTHLVTDLNTPGHCIANFYETNAVGRTKQFVAKLKKVGACPLTGSLPPVVVVSETPMTLQPSKQHTSGMVTSYDGQPLPLRTMPILSQPISHANPQAISLSSHRTSSLTRVPLEIWSIVLQNMNLASLLQMRATCRKFRHHCLSPMQDKLLAMLDVCSHRRIHGIILDKWFWLLNSLPCPVQKRHVEKVNLLVNDIIGCFKTSPRTWREWAVRHSNDASVPAFQNIVNSVACRNNYSFQCDYDCYTRKKDLIEILYIWIKSLFSGNMKLREEIMLCTIKVMNGSCRYVKTSDGYWKIVFLLHSHFQNDLKNHFKNKSLS